MNHDANVAHEDDSFDSMQLMHGLVSVTRSCETTRKDLKQICLRHQIMVQTRSLRLPCS